MSRRRRALTQLSDKVNPTVLPFTRRRHLEAVAAHFVVVAVVVVPELLAAHAVLDGELQRAAVLQVRGHDDLKAEPVGGAVARAHGHVGREAVHERDPVVERVAQRDALLERQVEDAHDARHAELVRLDALEQHLDLAHLLLEARQRARVGELQLHEHGVRRRTRELGLQVVQVERALGQFGQDALRHFGLVRVVEVLHGDEFQAEGVREPDLFLTRGAPAPGDLQLGPLRGRGERLAPAPQAGALRWLEEGLPAPRSLVHHRHLDGLAGAVHSLQLFPILEPRVGRCQASEESGYAAVVPRQAVLRRQHDRRRSAQLVLPAGAQSGAESALRSEQVAVVMPVSGVMASPGLPRRRERTSRERARTRKRELKCGLQT